MKLGNQFSYSALAHSVQSLVLKTKAEKVDI